MIRYIATSAALKLFSSTSLTKKLYRTIGNVWGSYQRKKSELPERYLERSKLFLSLLEKHHIVQDGHSFVELGTGWVHWDAIFVRLFHDVEISLYDVWDCRQLEAIKHNSRKLDSVIDDIVHTAPIQREHIHHLLHDISNVNSFKQLYQLLGFEYILDPVGCLDCFSDNSYDLAYSFDVLEHIKEGILSEFTQNLYRLLKSGAYSIHQIDLCDHLAYYDRRLLPKNYLRYSDSSWKRWFQNEVQYFNRLQRPEWLSLFQNAGLELVEEQSQFTPIGDVVPIGRFEHFDRQDLECTTLTLVHKKPC
jgi:hypothetical protein